MYRNMHDPFFGIPVRTNKVKLGPGSDEPITRKFLLISDNLIRPRPNRHLST